MGQARPQGVGGAGGGVKEAPRAQAARSKRHWGSQGWVKGGEGEGRGGEGRGTCWKCWKNVGFSFMSERKNFGVTR